jgi:hypothetical protein
MPIRKILCFTVESVLKRITLVTKFRSKKIIAGTVSLTLSITIKDQDVCDYSSYSIKTGRPTEIQQKQFAAHSGRKGYVLKNEKPFL